MTRKGFIYKVKKNKIKREVIDVQFIVMLLLHSATNTHILHLQTKSVSEHLALKTYYETIVELVDRLVESSQYNGVIIRGYPLQNDAFHERMTATTYLSRLEKKVEMFRKIYPISYDSTDGILDSIQELIRSTLYKLKTLK